jgi:SAM-dependent methyltransferase
MTNRTERAAYFDRIYEADADPWDYTSSPYEAEKYAATLAALPRGRFQNALEAGCSIGILTQRLACRCDHLLAIDASAVAIARARRLAPRCLNISFEQREIPRAWPAQQFDLVLFSEVLYYLSPDELDSTARCAIASLAANGVVAMVNWLGEAGAPQTGEQAADRFVAQTQPALRQTHRLRTSDYRIDILER